MVRKAREYAFFKRRIWNALSSIEFEEWDSDVEEEPEFGLLIDLEATVSFDDTHLVKLAEKKRDYLEASRQETVSDEEVVEYLTKDIENSFDIILNRVGYDVPPEGLYKRINSTQWEQEFTEEYYPIYKDLLWDLTEDMEGIPSVPELYRPFLFAVSESDEHELPPEGAVENILTEHLDSMRVEKQSRIGVSKLKKGLENKGVNARVAASVAQSMEEYLKTDSELEELDSE